MSSLKGRPARRVAIKQVTFSNLSHIILEYRAAIIQKVESLIPAGCQNVLLLLGRTGSGKSTTMSFLRRDRMKKREDNTYVSLDDQAGIIGHGGSVSCTFLPNVEIVDDLAIIDFPGFDDTNGRLCSLGMELALKALAARYNAKVLVLVGFPANNDGRNATEAELGARIGRIFSNKRDCIAGVTHYSYNSSYQETQRIEERQSKSELEKVKDENDILERIERLLKLNLPELQPVIETDRNKLEEIRRQKKQKQEEDESKKTKILEDIHQKEKELLVQIGLENIIRFSDLENPDHLLLCINEIAQKGRVVRVCGKSNLCSEDERLLKNKFDKNLKKELLENESYYNEFNDIKEFERSVLYFSLIKTVLAFSHPEIGEFLHLPEMDPALVKDFDKIVASSCIRKCIGVVLGEIKLIEEMIAKFGSNANEQKLSDVNKLIDKIKKCIIGLEGIAYSTNQEKEKEWDRLKDHYINLIGSASRNIEDEFRLTGWAKYFAGWADTITFNKFDLSKKKVFQDVLELKNQDITHEYLDMCSKALITMRDSLLKLKELEKIILKKDELDIVVLSMTLSLESKNDFSFSLQKRIDSVRTLYGESDWDHRIDILTSAFEKFFLFVKGIDIHVLKGVYLPMLLLFLEQSSEIECIGAETDLKRLNLWNSEELSLEKNCLRISEEKLSSVFLFKRYVGSESKIDHYEIASYMANTLSELTKRILFFLADFLIPDKCDPKEIAGKLGREFAGELGREFGRESVRENLNERVRRSKTEFEDKLEKECIKKRFRRNVKQTLNSRIIENHRKLWVESQNKKMSSLRRRSVSQLNILFGLKLNKLFELESGETFTEELVRVLCREFGGEYEGDHIMIEIVNLVNSNTNIKDSFNLAINVLYMAKNTKIINLQDIQCNENPSCHTDLLKFLREFQETVQELEMDLSQPLHRTLLADVVLREFSKLAQV